MAKMKKMFGLLVLAVFMMSIVPLVAAESDSKTEALQKAKMIQVRHDQFNEKYELIKQRHEETKQKLLDQREHLNLLREKLKASVRGTGEYDATNLEIKNVAKDKLARTVELIQRSLEKLTDRVENSNALTDEEKQEALDKIAELEASLSAKIEEIEALDPTSENYRLEFRAKVKELKDLWNEVRRGQKWIVTQLVNNKMGNVVDKHEEYYNAMNVRISTLVEMGADEATISDLESKAESFNEAVAELKEDYKVAQEAWAEVRVANTPEALEKAKEKQNVVREDLKETKELLREFISAYKEAYNKVKDSTSEPESEPEV